MAKANANAKSILDSIINIIGYILDTDWKHYCCIWSRSPTVYLGYIYNIYTRLETLYTAVSGLSKADANAISDT